MEKGRRRRRNTDSRSLSFAPTSFSHLLCVSVLTYPSYKPSRVFICVG